jgi:hypothetical protein
VFSNENIGLKKKKKRESCLFAHLVGVRGAVERRRAERGERGGADSVDVGAGRLGGAAVLGDARVCETLLAACTGSERNERTNERIGQIRSEHQNAEEERKCTQNADRKIEQKDRAGSNSTILGVI